MVMCFAGDFEPENIIREVEKRLVEKPHQGEIKRIYQKEIEEIVEPKKEVSMEVSMPIFVIGIKDTEKQTENSQNIIKKHIAIEILLNMIIGKSSDLYKKLYEQELLMSEPYLEYEFTDKYAHIAITGQSKNPEEIMQNIKQTVKSIKENGIDKSHFERIKNMLYGTAVKEFNNVSDIARMFVTDYFKGVNSLDYLENYENVTVEYAKQILEDIFKEEKMIISIVKPKK